MTNTARCVRWMFLLCLVCSAVAVSRASVAPQSNDRGLSRQETLQKDSADRARLTNVDEVARRVDSLQFIVVYNAQLLQRDLDAKVVWIYVMLGVMIIASMMMYGALNQAQRHRKELEERVFSTIASTVSELEAKIKQVETRSEPPPVPKKTAPPKKKK